MVVNELGEQIEFKRDVVVISRQLRAAQSVVELASDDLQQCRSDHRRAQAGHSLQNVLTCLTDCLQVAEKLGSGGKVHTSIRSGDYVASLKAVTTSVAESLGPLQSVLGLRQDSELKREFDSVQQGLEVLRSMDVQATATRGEVRRLGASSQQCSAQRDMELGRVVPGGPRHAGLVQAAGGEGEGPSQLALQQQEGADPHKERNKAEAGALYRAQVPRRCQRWGWRRGGRRHVLGLKQTMNVLRLGSESSADDEDAGSHRSSSKDSGSATGSSGSSNGSDRGRAPPRCVPLSFACPITRCVMRDPVVLVETGCSFERGAIECHLYARNTDPLTNSQLRTRALAPNRGLRDAIEEWLLGAGLTHDQADDLPVTAGPRPAALGMLTSGSPTDPGGPPTAPAAGPEASQQAGVRVDPCKLWDAAEAGDVGALRRVLASGVDVDARDEDGTTALHFAAAHGHVEAVRVLLAAGASKDAARPSDAATALYFAVMGCFTDTVEVLLDAGANTEARLREIEITPLHTAAENGFTEVVRALLSAGADPNASHEDGATPLFFAAWYGHTDTVVELLSVRPDIDACREDGINPLMAAAMHGHLDTVRVLVAAGANLEARDRCKGKTAREWAKRMGHKKIAQLLKI